METGGWQGICQRMYRDIFQTTTLLRLMQLNSMSELAVLLYFHTVHSFVCDIFAALWKLRCLFIQYQLVHFDRNCVFVLWMINGM